MNLEQNRKRMIFGLAALILIAGPWSTSALAGQRDVPAEGVKSLAIENISGDVTLSAGSPSQIELRWKNGKGTPPKIEVVDGVLRVDDHPKDDGDAPWDLWLTLPPSLHVRVKSVSGDLNASDLKARVQLEAVSGDVVAKACGGALEIRTVSGDQRVEAPGGDLMIKTVSGEIEVSGAHSALLEIKTVSGDVKLEGDALGKVRVATTSGDVTIVGALSPSGGLSAKSFSGDVELRLPAKASFDLEASTRSGSVTVDHSLSGTKSEQQVSGRVGQGGVPVQLSSFSGNLRVRAAR